MRINVENLKNFLVLSLFMVSTLSSCHGMERKSQKEGLIIFLDGMPASGKSSVAKELQKLDPSFALLSSDDLAIKRRKPPLSFDDYRQAALDTLDEAIKLASLGNRVIVDSWITEKTLASKSSKFFQTRIFGLWCELSCLKARFDKREGVVNAWKNSALESDHKERYADQDDEGILKAKGSWRMESLGSVVIYDKFFNTENTASLDIAKDILNFLKLETSNPPEN